MKNTSENKSISEDLSKIDKNIKTDNPLESEDNKILSLTPVNEDLSNNSENVNEYIGYSSNAYYYTGKSIAKFNVKTITIVLLGLIIIIASTFFYFNNKNNLNPFIGFALGTLLLIIALIQFIYKKN